MDQTGSELLNDLPDCNVSDTELARLCGLDHGPLSTAVVPWHPEPMRLTPFLDQLPSDTEDVNQTHITIDTSPFQGSLNFKVVIEDSSSKQYSFSEKLNRLYITMDKLVPVKINWQGPPVVLVRAMLIYKDPDYMKSPVLRCRTHNDENYAHNRDFKYYKHVLRCSSDKSLYKENALSKRHSIVTSFEDLKGDGVTTYYKFMCFTTCSGVDAINRRRTDLVLTLEDANRHVLGRQVFEVKICSCPLRDKKRDEDDGNKNKKRRSGQCNGEYKKIKREVEVQHEEETMPLDFKEALIKREADLAETHELVNLQVDIPDFPGNKVDELKNVLKRVISSFYVSDQDYEEVTRRVVIHKN